MFTFTADNTQGFNQTEIENLNYALDVLQQEQPAVDEKTHSDRLTNVWVDGASIAYLVAAARVRREA